MTTRPERELIGLAIAGFRAAIDRVSAAPRASAHHMYVPLTEAAWWAICADDALAEVVVDYKSRRASDAHGQVLLGIRYARSALGHHWTFIARVGGGLTIPFTVPFAVKTYPVWVSVGDLPTFPHQATLRPEYENHLQNQSVLSTLRCVDTWFKECWNESD